MNDLNSTEQYANEIKAWMESGKDFNAGYLLFVRFSHNRAMALQFARKGPAMQSKLEYELEKILERNLIIDRPVMPIGPVVKAQANAENVTDSDVRIQNQDKKFELTRGKINPADLPDPVRILFDENSEKHKLMRSVHEQMKLAKKDGERAKLRKELITLDDRVSANWKAIDAYLENGTLPEVKQQKVQDPESYKEINAARSYLSRGIKSIEKLSGEKRLKMLGELKNRFMFLMNAKADIKPETFAALVKLEIAIFNDEDTGNK